MSSTAEPEALARRPHHGRFPIPFVTLVRDGRPDFRVQDNGRRERCALERLCQLCGEPLGERFVFCGWTASVERRSFGEAPMHPDCCDWAWAVCPFLAGGTYRQITAEDVVNLGLHPHRLDVAPRFMAVYTTTDYEPVPCGEGSGSVKWIAAPPLSIEWRDRQREAATLPGVSFAVNSAPHSAADIRGAVEKMEPGAHLSDRQLELLRLGKEQAIAALDNGTLADADAESDGELNFTVNITGHASGDKPAPGDQLTVGIAIGAAPAPTDDET